MTGETCDDSNTDSGDGCSSTCQTENRRHPAIVGHVRPTNVAAMDLNTTSTVNLTITQAGLRRQRQRRGDADRHGDECRDSDRRRDGCHRRRTLLQTARRRSPITISAMRRHDWRCNHRQGEACPDRERVSAERTVAVTISNVFMRRLHADGRAPRRQLSHERWHDFNVDRGAHSPLQATMTPPLHDPRSSTRAVASLTRTRAILARSTRYMGDTYDDTDRRCCHRQLEHADRLPRPRGSELRELHANLAILVGYGRLAPNGAGLFAFRGTQPAPQMFDRVGMVTPFSLSLALAFASTTARADEGIALEVYTGTRPRMRADSSRPSSDELARAKDSSGDTVGRLVAGSRRRRTPTRACPPTSRSMPTLACGCTRRASSPMRSRSWSS